VRFATDGAVRASRSLSLTAASTVTADARAIINGRAYWRVASGPLDAYWVVESSAAYHPGSVARMEFPAGLRLDLGAGTYTGFRYSPAGHVTGSETVRYGGTRTITAGAWKVINGVPHYLIGSGALAGTWVPETSSTRLHV
jgi:hypothetical protein